MRLCTVWTTCGVKLVRAEWRIVISSIAVISFWFAHMLNAAPKHAIRKTLIRVKQLKIKYEGWCFETAWKFHVYIRLRHFEAYPFWSTSRGALSKQQFPIQPKQTVIVWYRTLLLMSLCCIFLKNDAIHVWLYHPQTAMKYQLNRHPSGRLCRMLFRKLSTEVISALHPCGRFRRRFDSAGKSGKNTYKIVSICILMNEYWYFFSLRHIRIGFLEATSDATRRAMRLIIQRLHMKSGNKPNGQNLGFIHPHKQQVYWYTL